MELIKYLASLLCFVGLSLGSNIKLLIWTEGHEHTTYECRESPPFTVTAVRHIAFEAPYGTHDSQCVCVLFPVTLEPVDLYNVSVDVSFMTGSKSYPASDWVDSDNGLPTFGLHGDVLQFVFQNESLTESYNLHDSEVRITNGSATKLMCGSNKTLVIAPTPTPTPTQIPNPTDTPEADNTPVHHTENCPCLCLWVHCYIIIAVAVATLLVIIAVVIVLCIRRRRKYKTADLENIRRENSQATERLCGAENDICLTETKTQLNENHYEPI